MTRSTLSHILFLPDDRLAAYQRRLRRFELAIALYGPYASVQPTFRTEYDLLQREVKTVQRSLARRARTLVPSSLQPLTPDQYTEWGDEIEDSLGWLTSNLRTIIRERHAWPVDHQSAVRRFVSTSVHSLRELRYDWRVMEQQSSITLMIMRAFLSRSDALEERLQPLLLRQVFWRNLGYLQAQYAATTLLPMPEVRQRLERELCEQQTALQRTIAQGLALGQETSVLRTIREQNILWLQEMLTEQRPIVELHLLHQLREVQAQIERYDQQLQAVIAQPSVLP